MHKEVSNLLSLVTQRETLISVLDHFGADILAIEEEGLSVAQLADLVIEISETRTEAAQAEIGTA